MSRQDGGTVDPRLLAVRTPQHVDDSLFSRLLDVVAPDKRVRLLRYRVRSAAVSSLTADLLARLAAAVALKLGKEEITFATTPSGKPTLSGHPDYHFNISHSGSWVVAAQHPSEVGVDVQMVGPMDLRIAELAARFFSSTEVNDLLAQPEDARLAYFFDLWTLKESYTKAIGEGLRVSLSSFTVRKTLDGGVALIRHDPLLPAYAFRQYDIDSACRLSVCAATDDFPIAAHVIPFAELCAHHGIPMDR